MQSKQPARPYDPWTCACLLPQWWHRRSAAVSAGSSCYSRCCLHARANGNSPHPHSCFTNRKLKKKTHLFDMQYYIWLQTKQISTFTNKLSWYPVTDNKLRDFQQTVERFLNNSLDKSVGFFMYWDTEVSISK